ncbi:hypothetical protein CNMCM7691_005209 [Aspergillus felis]|uniref:Uncharacterized protein n=1 Tax=Aspergillus felis TaxID=1287682 RepID=A0A8H6R395_9EURO|nr:hypothetical protein CNMCM7691_005209 [Aspergillus felis]
MALALRLRLVLPLHLLATLVPALVLRSLLIRNNRLLRLPVYLRVLLVGRQPRRLQEPLRGTLQPTPLPLGRGRGRAGGVLLVRVARQREFPGEFLVADAAGTRVAAEGPQLRSSGRGGKFLGLRERMWRSWA